MKILFASLCFLALFFVSLQTAQACSCPDTLDPLEAKVKWQFDKASAVFTGEVLSISEIPQQQLAVKLKVKDSWKGEVGKEMTVTTSKWSASCGVYFEIGKSYLIIGYKSEKGELSAYLCTFTREISRSKDVINILDNLKPASELPVTILTGTIYDVTGTGIAGAKIKLTDEDGIVYEALTGSDGSYKIGVASGTYNVEASATYFKVYKINKYLLTPAGKGQQNLDVALEVGAIDEAVKVTKPQME